MLAPDAMLGPYRIVSLLGEGGMGAVYRAKDTRLGRDVAIKILTALTLSDQERVQRFEQEARATGMLNHPNLLTIYDVGNEGGTAYIVSELLEGATLRERLERGPLPPRRAVDAALQVANGLAAAHEKGIIHRDLKPDNIFLTRDGRAKILDFGIAKLSAKSDDGGMFQQAATEPGMVLGTVGYMSPEQVRGEKVDTRSDIFAFGAILYEMLTGSRAFKRSSSIETLSAILKEDPPDLAEALPNIPPALERLTRRCLEKDRELRFQSARDLAFNLETMSAMSTPGTLSNVANPLQSTTMRIQPDAPTRTSATAIRPVTSAMPSTVRTTARTATLARPMPRRVSPILLTLLFVVAIAGAAWGGWYFATNQMKAEAPPEVVFHRMTFRRGEVRSARFGPDGDSIVYSAAWDGNSSEVFVANRQSPEARPLGVKDADILAISKLTELAILLRRDRLTGLGTLARVPLAGGTPREVAEQVLQADWSPDGANLTAIVAGNGTFRIESPLGRVRYETPHALRDVRVASDGRIAFIETYSGKNDVAVLDVKSAKPVSIARGWSHGATGLAWAPGGKEIWITATDSGAPPALYGVSVDTGDTRLINRLTGSMRLYDIAAAGHVLLSNGMWRAALEVQAPGETAERDLSWLDWSILADLSRDGRTILFNEPREGGGAASAMYLRRLDAPTPVRIADGYGDAISPDGKYVLGHSGAKLVVVPTGSGEARELKTDGAFDLGAVWLPDARRVVIAGALPKKGYQLLVIDTLDESVKPVSPEGIWGDAYRPFAVSPDGHYAAGMTKQQTIALYPIDAAAEPSIVPAIEPGEIPIAWSADGASLFVHRPTALPAQVTRVTLATGARQPWKQFSPTDPAGVYKIAPICITSDGTAYAYDALRILGDLYVVDGLR
ncbi:MAG TPA: serine/threonine-protein kinase [Thermoanaerobaculia bacterium]|nr:serine/threonine-protein kinase [Thermoanaerobaculia bacterium]